MLYLSLLCLNLLYKSMDVYNSGGGVVPNSDVYKYSDPLAPVWTTYKYSASVLISLSLHSLS